MNVLVHRVVPLTLFFCLLASTAFCETEMAGKFSGIPDSSSPVERAYRISFSGFQWMVRDNASKQGPGPNYFRQKQVWVDHQGWLHLLLSKDRLSGEWLAAEITSANNFGFGDYQFLVEGRPDRFDKNIVLGLFNYSGKDGYDEMDIEFARWGNDSFPNLNYTIWPATDPYKNAATTHAFSLTDHLSLHAFRRSRDSVICSSYQGTEALKSRLIFRSVFTSPPSSISQLAMPVHINLWLFNGNPPADRQQVEIIIRRFVFNPA